MTSMCVPCAMRTPTRTSGPTRKGHALIKTKTDLATTNPRLAEEWDYERNGSLFPSDVMAGSSRVVWWKCLTYGYAGFSHVVDDIIYKTERNHMPQSIKNSRHRKIIASVLILSLLGATPSYAFLRTGQARADEMQAYTSAKNAQSDLQSTQDALTALSQDSENDTIADQISTNNKILASDISTKDAGPFDYETHEESASRLQTVSETISTAEQSSRAIVIDVLQGHIDTLNQSIDANRDQVEDPSSIDKATDDIGHAKSLIVNASCPPSDISDAADTLAADCQAIADSHANWVIQKDREAALARSSAAYVADITDDTWDAGTTVWYTGIYPPAWRLTGI